MNIVEPSYQILDDIDPQAILRKLELCGRVAYKSEDKITLDSAERFITAILKRGHESVIEHVNPTVRFICDRGVTHEIVRHRLVAYTQESTRYCNYSKLGITFIKPSFWYHEGHDYELYLKHWMAAMQKAEEVYNILITNGAKPEQARSVLPNSLKTEVVCTANLREWRHIMCLRTGRDAHPQMRQIMVPLLKELRVKLPVLFNDAGSVEDNPL